MAQPGDDGPAPRPWADIRSQFPITESRAYLFAGGIAPLSIAGRAAIERYSAVWADDPIEAYRTHPAEQAELLRAEIAGLIRARPGDVTLVDSTSRGNNLAVQLLAAPPGANVVVDATTYPSALQPWLLRADVEVRRLPDDDGIPSVGALQRLLDERTAAVSVSHVCRLTGFRHDLARLGAAAHGVGAALVVDAAQSAGVVPIDVAADGVDFLSFGAMKWLLGMPGIAFLYVDPAWEERERLLHGSLAWIGLEASRAGLRLLRQAPEHVVESRVLDLSGAVVDGLHERGVRVRTPRSRARRAGVVAFEHPSPARLARALRGHGVDVWGWERQGLVRVDPHVYNDGTDVDRFLAALDRELSVN